MGRDKVPWGSNELDELSAYLYWYLQIFSCFTSWLHMKNEFECENCFRSVLEAVGIFISSSQATTPDLRGKFIKTLVVV